MADDEDGTVRFGTSGVRGPVGEAVTAETALSVGRAVATEGARTVLVGRDPRTSGPLLTDALSAGLRECGADVLRIGEAATPTVARAIGWHDADAGVSVTASHNPPTDNGLKLWTPSGQAYDAEERAAIEAVVEEGDYDLRPWDALGEQRSLDGARERHVDAVTGAVTVEDPLSVVVDLGNGVGSVTVDALLELGCSVTTLNATPDGRFPGRPSEPTAENLTVLRGTVANTDADIGLAHDGDADRLLAVDETGAFVQGDVLLALFARSAVETHGAGTVAAPVNTSLAVDDAVADLGGSIVRTRVGDVFVAERASAPDVVFGGEPSGAWIWPEETLCPDGPLAACRLVELVADRGPLSDLVAGVDTYPIRRESVETGDKRRVMDDVETRVRDRYDPDVVGTVDGVRVETDGGWFLIRASGTQPLVRVTAEARSETRADELLETARSVVERST